MDAELCPTCGSDDTFSVGSNYECEDCGTTFGLDEEGTPVHLDDS